MAETPREWAYGFLRRIKSTEPFDMVIPESLADLAHIKQKADRCDEAERERDEWAARAADDQALIADADARTKRAKRERDEAVKLLRRAVDQIPGAALQDDVETFLSQIGAEQ